MMKNHGQRQPEDAALEFSQWASLFSGEIFVKIVAYADESGTHDKTGVQKGSREAIIAGVAALREDWAPFCHAWQTVLNKYRAPYFHFREWSSASAVARKIRQPETGFEKNPYRHLDLDKLNSFLIELAKIAGSGNKMVFGSRHPTAEMHELQAAGHYPNKKPFQLGAEDFFSNFLESLDRFKAPWKRQRVSFFFDQSDDAEWRHVITDAFFLFKSKHPQFSEITFADKKLPPHLPLQAADMYAYRARYMFGKFQELDFEGTWPNVDSALMKPMIDFSATRPPGEVAGYFKWRMNR
jgi:hypothetical protein